MLVREIMSKDVPRVPSDGSLQDAASRMFSKEVTYCLVLNDDVPMGLLTDRMLLRASYKTRKPLTDIPVSVFANGFAVTVSPNRTIVYAVGLMSKHDVDYLPVLEGLTFHGVLTQGDIASNLSNFRKEALDNAMSRKG